MQDVQCVAAGAKILRRHADGRFITAAEASGYGLVSSRRPQLGDLVELTDPTHRFIGRRGVVVQDDGTADATPFRLQWADNGSFSLEFFRAKQVTLRAGAPDAAALGAPSAPARGLTDLPLQHRGRGGDASDVTELREWGPGLGRQLHGGFAAMPGQDAHWSRDAGPSDALWTGAQLDAVGGAAAHSDVALWGREQLRSGEGRDPGARLFTGEAREVAADPLRALQQRSADDGGPSRYALPSATAYGRRTLLEFI